jgi:hypothetical protein
MAATSMATPISVPTDAATMTNVLVPEEGVVLEGSVGEGEVDVALGWTLVVVGAAVPLLVCDLAVVVIDAGAAVNPLSRQ